MHKKRNKRLVTHMAGIVPLAAPRLDFSMPWSDCLIPISQDYLAVERAVYECALAGCETIWVVCHWSAEPLIRKRLGDFISDPVSLTIGLNPSFKRKDISIMYVPIRPSDIPIKDSFAWSLLYGADTAFRISAYLSRWIIPEKFYCASPYGLCDDKTIWKNRKKITTTEKTVFRFNNQTFKNGLHMSFTFNEDDYLRARNNLKKILSDNWSLRSSRKEKLTIEDVFCDIVLQEEHIIEHKWHYDISNWANYKIFLSSPESSLLEKNSKVFITKKRKVFMPRSMQATYRQINEENTAPKIEVPDNLENL